MKSAALLMFLGMGLFAQETGTPTTIIGAFIVIAIAATTLNGFVVKKLLDDAKDDRAKFAATLKEIEDGQQSRNDAEDNRIAKLIDAQNIRTDRYHELHQVEQQKQRDHDAKMTASLHAVVLEIAKQNAEVSRNMRVAVHDAKDTANAVSAKADLVIEQAKRNS